MKSNTLKNSLVHSVTVAIVAIAMMTLLFPTQAPATQLPERTEAVRGDGSPAIASKNLRIITLAPHIVEMLYSIGVGDQIIGTTERSDYPLEANSIVEIGNYARLKVEQILALQPDLIIAWRTGNPSDDLARLESLGLNIVYSDPVNLRDVAKELRLFGQLTGANEEAENQASRFETELTAIEQTYKNKVPITVFYELWSRPLTTVANNAWPQQYLSVCGASNPFVVNNTDYPQIGLEQVVLAKPQLIIQPVSPGKSNADAVNWRQWPEIPAVKYDQFIHPDPDKLHRMTPRLIGELEKLCVSIEHARTSYR